MVNDPLGRAGVFYRNELRDKFAMVVLKDAMEESRDMIFKTPEDVDIHRTNICAAAYQWADAMLREREK